MWINVTESRSKLFLFKEEGGNDFFESADWLTLISLMKTPPTKGGEGELSITFQNQILVVTPAFSAI